MEDISGLLEAMFGSGGGDGGGEEGAGQSTGRHRSGSAADDSGDKDDHDGGSDPAGGGSGSGNDPSKSEDRSFLEKAQHLPDGPGEVARSKLHEKDESDDSQQSQPRGRRGSHQRKRHRTAAMHNLAERKRREKLNEKLRDLQHLISADPKIDKSSMLDAAIAYVRNLQQQLMSGTCNVCHSRLLMQSGVTTHCAAAQIPQPIAPYPAANMYQPQPGGIPFIPMAGMLPPHLQMSPLGPMFPTFSGPMYPLPAAPLPASTTELSKAEDESDKPAASHAADREPN